MAAEVKRIILAETLVNLDLRNNHIKCFCHKLALILNAGLKEIQISTHREALKQGSSTLGFVPTLDPVQEESEHIVESNEVEETWSEGEDDADGCELSQDDMEREGSDTEFPAQITCATGTIAKILQTDKNVI